MVEQVLHTDKVTGSNPVTAIYADIAQLGEHLPYKQGVTGSRPVICTVTFKKLHIKIIMAP